MQDDVAFIPNDVEFEKGSYFLFTVQSDLDPHYSITSFAILHQIEFHNYLAEN